MTLGSETRAVALRNNVEHAFAHGRTQTALVCHYANTCTNLLERDKRVKWYTTHDNQFYSFVSLYSLIHDFHFDSS